MTTELGRIATEHILGIHVNGPITMPSWDEADAEAWSGEGGEQSWQTTEPEYSPADQAKLDKLTGAESYTRFGYAMVQAGRPQTLAIGMHDSPAGLLSWIVDMFQRWTNPAIELPEDAVDRDRLLTNISLYWFTRTFASSIRLYGEGGFVGCVLAQLRRTDGRGGLSWRQFHSQDRRGAAQYRALGRVRPRRPLRPDGSAGPADLGYSRVLPLAALS